MTTTTNVLQRPRKDSQSVSTLMALDEEDGNQSSTPTNDDDEQTTPPNEEIETKSSVPNDRDMRKFSDSNLPASTLDNIKHNKKVKASRRSSLGLGLLMGSNKNESNKNCGNRASSFATIFI